MFLYPLALVSLWIIISDVRYQLIPLWSLLAFGAITFCNFIPFNAIEIFIPSLILLAAIVSLSWVLERKNGAKAIGSGDILLLGLSGFWISMDQIPLFFILAGVLGVVTGILWRILFNQQHFPFAPAILLALLCAVIPY